MQEFYAVKLKMSASYDVYCCSKQTPESIEKKKKKKNLSQLFWLLGSVS